MYKHFFLLAAVCYSSFASAQEISREFQKGQYLVGVNGMGGFSNGPAYRSPRWSVSPWAGYFVATNLAAGLRTSFGRDLYDLHGLGSDGMLDYRYNSLAPEAFLRYYVHGIKIKPFVQVAAGYNFQWGHSGKEVVSASNFIGSIEGGIRFPIGRRFSIDPSYSRRAFSKSALNDANERNRWRLGVSFRLSR